MKPISKIKYMQLSMVSKPAADRAIYRAIRKYKVRSIVEIGLGDGARASNMIQVAQRFAESKTVRYTGIDLFDGRTDDRPKLNLIDVHKHLNQLKAKTQLVPGEPHQAICRIANSHVRTDLVVISAGYDEVSMKRSWFYMPRMIHANSLVFVQDANSFDSPFRLLSRLHVEQLADKHGLARPMAA